MSTAASKTKHRKTYHSYSSCTSDSSTEDEDQTIIHRAYFHDSRRSSPAVLRGVVGRKKLPAEVERAQQRTEQQPIKEQPTARKPLQKMQSVSSAQSSDDSDFIKLPVSRRPSSAKKKLSTKRQSGKSAKSTPDENINSKPNPKSRATAKRSNSSRRFTPKKKSPSKQHKTQRSPSKSPSPYKHGEDEDYEESAGHHDENTDEEEDRYRSSTSPPPLGKRQTRHSILHRASFNQVTETVNLGGSPQFGKSK
jgi:hypothetical protein